MRSWSAAEIRGCEEVLTPSRTRPRSPKCHDAIPPPSTSRQRPVPHVGGPLAIPPVSSTERSLQASRVQRPGEVDLGRCLSPRELFFSSAPPDGKAGGGIGGLMRDRDSRSCSGILIARMTGEPGCDTESGPPRVSAFEHIGAWRCYHVAAPTFSPFFNTDDARGCSLGRHFSFRFCVRRCLLRDREPRPAEEHAGPCVCQVCDEHVAYPIVVTRTRPTIRQTVRSRHQFR